MRRLSTVLWSVGQHGCDPFPSPLACCVHCTALHMRPSHSGVASAGDAPNPRFVSWTTADLTFERCKWQRRPCGCATSLRYGLASWCVTFIFHLLRRGNRLPVACAIWQARSTALGNPLCATTLCPQQLSRPISHTHLAHISRYEQGNLTGNTRRLCPPQPGLPDWHGQQKSRGAPCPSPCICHKPRGCCDVVQMLSLHPFAWQVVWMEARS